MRTGIPPKRAVAQVRSGAADYAVGEAVSPADAPALAARYGAGSPAARQGHQQYFVSTRAPGLDFLALNTHRPLFADARMRRAVNYAIDRDTLARLGGYGAPLSEQPTDHYLPPGIPGSSEPHIYPMRPDIAKARRLAAHPPRRTAVLYTCKVAPCPQQAQVIKTDLAAIGLHVTVKQFTPNAVDPRLVRPGEPFDLAYLGWLADYPDPDNVLNLLLEDGSRLPTFDDPAYRRRLAAAARLTGAQRYLTYARLDADLTRHAAPWVAIGNATTHEFFSARVGCQIYGLYDVDLAALCRRR
jgi:ABC-type transport system substrate-binding protein